jgi:purine-binding chemotaxis protein CheW
VKNVIIFVLGGERFAVELRWVREIFPLGPITPVPGAPAAFAGAVNFRGAIVPVLRAGTMLSSMGLVDAATPPPSRAPKPGDAAVLLDVDGLRAALTVDRVDEVTTLEACLEGEGTWEDPRGKPVRVLDPAAILGAARKAVADETSRAGKS